MFVTGQIESTCVAQRATTPDSNLVTELIRARNLPSLMKPLALRHRTLTVSDAYRLQSAVDRELRRQGHVLAGYKVAFTTPKSRDRWGVKEPCRAPLYWQDVAPHRSTISSREFCHFHLEAEIAVLLKTSILSEPVSVAELLDHVASVHVAFDIPDLRFETTPQWPDGPDLIADSLGARRWCVGIGVEPSKFDLRTNIELYRNGELHSVGPSTASDGGCWNVLRWLASDCLKHGQPLTAGQYVLTGPVSKAYFPSNREEVLGTYSAKANGLGEIVIRVE